MKKILTLLLLATLLLTACNTPAPPIDDATTTASTGEESTTPADNETTTPEDIETTTPQESESDTTAQIPPEELLTEFPKIDKMETWNGWLAKTISKYKNPALKDIEPLEGYDYFWFPKAFSGYMGPNEILGVNIGQQEVNYKYRIQHITLLDENHVCVIYKILRDNQEKYMYRVFEKEVLPGNFDKYGGYEQEYWHTSFEAYYVTKSLKYSDFSSFKVGDTLEKLTTIEPACWIDDVWSYGVENDEGAAYWSYALLLEDGVLHITLRCENFQEVKTREDIKSLFLATDIQFYPNGTDAEINGQPLSILKATNRPPLPSEDD